MEAPGVAANCNSSGEKSATLKGAQSLDELKRQTESLPKDTITTLEVTSSKFALSRSDLFERFSDLEHLHLAGNEITEWDYGVFEDLQNLRYLKLDDCKLFAIDEERFCNLSSLFSLEITHNKIHRLNDGIFKGLENLGHLVLRDNQIEYVDKEAFKGLKTLFSLELSDNKLQNLNTGVFDDLPNLGHLILKNNLLRHLGGKVFTGLKNLVHLDLSHNQLRKLPKGLFHEVSIKGHCLNLSHNCIEEIERDALWGLNVAEGIVDLTHNRIEKLQMGSLTCITAKKLLLTNNSISSIEAEAFDGSNFEDLHLDKNKLTDWSPKAFRNLTINQNFYLSNNTVSLRRGMFEDLKQLPRLYLNKNQINNLPDHSFQDLQNLQLLDLSKNNINSINPDSFSGLSDLVILVLDKNNISTFSPKALQHTPNLLTLCLNNNNLQTLELGTFSNLPSLRDICLNFNNFTSFPPNTLYEGLDKIGDLEFAGIKTKAIPSRSFVPQGASRRLFFRMNITNSEINTVEPGAFDGIEFVKYLCMFDNRISDLSEDSFKGLGLVNRLNLDNNLIDSVSVLKKLPRCRLVRLDGNKVESTDLVQALNEIGLDQIEVISFEKFSYEKVGCKWVFVDSPVDNVEEEIEEYACV